MNLLIEILREKHDQRNLEDMHKSQELSEHLCEWLIVWRKEDKEFEPFNLSGMFSSFNRHLKEGKYSVSVIEGVASERARKCLEAQ